MQKVNEKNLQSAIKKNDKGILFTLLEKENKEGIAELNKIKNHFIALQQKTLAARNKKELIMQSSDEFQRFKIAKIEFESAKVELDKKELETINLLNIKKLIDDCKEANNNSNDVKNRLIYKIKKDIKKIELLGKKINQGIINDIILKILSK